MLSQEVFDVFYNALRKWQILTYNGLFTTGNKLSRPNSLTNSEKRTPLSTFGFSCIAGALVNTSKPKNEELTPEEQERLAGQMIEEVDDDEQ